MKYVAELRKFTNKNTWIWALLGSLTMWLVIGLVSRNLNFESLVANVFSASFLALAALGQMLVITTGRGAIDLSIPGVITLIAYLNVTYIAGNDTMIIPGILLILVVGVTIGILNSISVIFLKIPPMIATMAMNYILTTISLKFNSAMGLEQLSMSKLLLDIARGRCLGIYYVIWIVIAVAFVLHFVLTRTTYGKSLVALGQNNRAAYFSGVSTVRVEMLTYVLCSVFAAIAGLLISLRVGGAFLGMGESYMLETVGGVVLGGTLISGGKCSSFGTLFGCLFLVLVLTAMQLANFDLGMKNIVKGALIILVILISTQSQSKLKV